MRAINRAIIHCAVTPPDWMEGQSVEAKKAAIDKWHKDRGWKGFGYHYLIDRDGKIAEGRPLSEVGAHAKGHNADSIGICLVGGHGGSRNDLFTDHYTTAQSLALRTLIEELQKLYGPLEVIGHNDVANKDCPCFDAKAWWGQKPPRKITESTTLRAAGGSAVGVVASAVTALSQLDERAQFAVVIGTAVVLLMLGWIARERIRKWSEGWK